MSFEYFRQKNILDFNTTVFKGKKYERVKNEGVAAEVYDLSGRKITNSKLSKGIYIVNGKKVLK